MWTVLSVLTFISIGALGLALAMGGADTTAARLSDTPNVPTPTDTDRDRDNATSTREDTR